MKAFSPPFLVVAPGSIGSLSLRRSRLAAASRFCSAATCSGMHPCRSAASGLAPREEQRLDDVHVAARGLLERVWTWKVLVVHRGSNILSTKKGDLLRLAGDRGTGAEVDPPATLKSVLPREVEAVRRPGESSASEEGTPSSSLWSAEEARDFGLAPSRTRSRLRNDAERLSVEYEFERDMRPPLARPASSATQTAGSRSSRSWSRRLRLRLRRPGCSYGDRGGVGRRL